MNKQPAENERRIAFKAMRESLRQTIAALEGFHKERPEGEGLAYMMMRRARIALVLADKVTHE